MSDNPKISIIIPCYNYGIYLDDAIQSIKKQTFTENEIIIVNDGSTEKETLDILHGIRNKYPEITVIDQKNGHLANARNSGIKISKGEYILPLDADDMVHPDMLRICYDVLQNNPHIGFAYTQSQLFGTIHELWESKPYNFDELLNGNYIVATSLIRKKCWEQVGGYDENMKYGYEDWEFYIRLGIAGWKGQLIEQTLFLYRKHGESMITDAISKHERIFNYIKEKHALLYLSQAQKSIEAKNNTIEELTREMHELRASKFWKLRSFYMRLKNYLRVS